MAENTAWEGCLTAELAGYTFGGVSWRTVVADWAASANHREAMLDRGSTAAGVGIYRSGTDVRLCLLLGK